MELYESVSYDLSKDLTLRYSTSFGTSSKLFPESTRRHIYAIYGLVRIADEIVDTYRGEDSLALLDELETEVYGAIERGYSVNPLVHSFSLTARQFSITNTLIKPFFDSMRMDLSPQTYTSDKYEMYIYGSAEVVGLMCLRVFVGNNQQQYKALEHGARKLGSAFQKINFLRDIASDYKDLGRLYFPSVEFETFDDDTKRILLEDIRKDFAEASVAIQKLPNDFRRAVSLSYVYYVELMQKIEHTPAKILKQKRVRLSNFKKATLLVSTFTKKSRSI